jgi:hypothetical protein
MIFGVEELFDLSSCGIYMNPSSIGRKPETITRKSRIDKPISDGRDRFRARRKGLYDLSGCIVLAILG